MDKIEITPENALERLDGVAKKHSGTREDHALLQGSATLLTHVVQEWRRFKEAEIAAKAAVEAEVVAKAAAEMAAKAAKEAVKAVSSNGRDKQDVPKIPGRKSRGGKARVN